MLIIPVGNDRSFCYAIDKLLICVFSSSLKFVLYALLLDNDTLCAFLFRFKHQSIRKNNNKFASRQRMYVFTSIHESSHPNEKSYHL